MPRHISPSTVISHSIAISRNTVGGDALRVQERQRRQRRGAATLVALVPLMMVWVVLGMAIIAFPAAPAAAQAAAVPEPPTEPITAIHAYRMENQGADDALKIVRPLLSETGQARIHTDGKTVVIRDTLVRIQRIAPALARFDHPKRPVDVEIQIVRATSERFSPPAQNQVPEEMLATLRRLLPYHTYRLIARTHLSTSEGEHLDYQLGESFGVNFRLGTLTEQERLRLHGFRIVRGQRDGSEADNGAAAAATATTRRRDDFGREILLHTNVNLRMGQTLYLGLAASESSPEALMVVLTATAAAVPEPRTQRAE